MEGDSDGRIFQGQETSQLRRTQAWEHVLICFHSVIMHCRSRCHSGEPCASDFFLSRSKIVARESTSSRGSRPSLTDVLRSATWHVLQMCEDLADFFLEENTQKQTSKPILITYNIINCSDFKKFEVPFKVDTQLPTQDADEAWNVAQQLSEQSRSTASASTASARSEFHVEQQKSMKQINSMKQNWHTYLDA